MLAPVARPPAPRRAAIWSFFLNVIFDRIYARLIQHSGLRDQESIHSQRNGQNQDYQVSECAHNRVSEEESSLIDASGMDIRVPEPGYGRTDSDFEYHDREVVEKHCPMKVYMKRIVFFQGEKTRAKIRRRVVFTVNAVGP